MADKREPVHKITLGTGKVVLIREPKIRDQETAMQIAAGRAQNDTMIGVHAQKELLKILLAAVDDRVLKASEKEDLDALFSYREFMQLNQVMVEIAGGKDLGNFKSEIVLSGGK